MQTSTIPTKVNGTFWIHLFLTAISWFIPFLFDWKLVVSAYTVVLMQFVLFGGCLMNRGHGLEDSNNDHTFYAHLLEHLGFKFNRRKVKIVVRLWIYVFLTAVTLLYQVVLGFEPAIY